MSIHAYIWEAECDGCGKTERSKTHEDRGDFAQRLTEDGWLLTGSITLGAFDDRRAECPRCAEE